MNVLNKFTKQNLKLNKKRSIVTIIGIMLSTALICAVAGMVTSTQASLVKLIKENQGDYHVCFRDVPNDQLKYIEKNAEVKSYFKTNSLGYANLNESQNDDKPYVYVMEYDKEALKNGAIKIVDGRLPENNNELVISEHIIDNGRVGLRVGDEITLDIGTRQLNDGTVLNQNNPYIINGEKSSESIIDTSSKTYKIVGIMERLSYETEEFAAPGYTVISYLENKDNLTHANISVTYKNIKENATYTENIVKTIQNNTGKKVTTTTNQELLRYEGAIGDASLKVLYGIASVVIVIIVVSSVFVIRNSFSISVSEKTKQYGMLTSIGATKKQIRKTVLLEGFFIGLIAIPLGILCGILAIIILLWVVNVLLGDMLNGASFIYSVPFLAIGLSIVISAITIYLSCIIPARRASKIPPIEAIRGNDDIKIKSKKIRTSKLIKKLFGIGGTIASKNLKRCKKKYRTTVISLVVSIAIFVSLSSFLEYGKRMTNMYYINLSYNVAVNANTEEQYKEIIKLNNLTDYSYTYSMPVDLDINKYGTEFGKKVLSERKDKILDPDDCSQAGCDAENSLTIIVYNKDYFKKFVKQLGMDENKYNEVAILEDDLVEYETDGSKSVRNYYDLKEGDTIPIKLNNKEQEIKVSKKTDERPMGYEQTYSNGGYLFVSEDFMNIKETAADTIHLESLNVNTDDSTKLENNLTDLKKQNSDYADLSVTNFDLYLQQSKRLILLISIFLYGFIAVITLIGVTNIFNTITTNMILRSKEFANLKSIGMTTKEFNKMIRLESIMYGLKSLLIGLPIGIAGSYAIYKSFANSVDFGYILPWLSIGISVVFVFLIVGLTMKYSLKKINKQNIIDTIRQDNI